MVEQSILERVAREICNIQYIDADHVPDGFNEPNWKGCIDEARAVLMAIREPSEAMKEFAVSAYADPMVAGRYIVKGDANKVWQAMIDAALEAN